MRRLFFLVGIFFLIVGASFIFVFTQSQKTPSQRRGSEITEQATAPGLLRETGEEAKVFRVIDGDTIELSDGRRVRYIGIDTPEIVQPRPIECFGGEAKEANRMLVEQKNIRLIKDISDVDTYGRLLRYVYVGPPAGETGNLFVNDFLVRQGFARATAYPPDVAFADQFGAAEKEAKEWRRGLWNSCVRLVE